MKAINTLIIAGIGLLIMSQNKTRWTIPDSGLKYKSIFDKVESDLNLPGNLLARVAYQESRFRDDIISGRVKSAKGARGIMQIIPKWHPGIDPLDIPEAITYAGEYLLKLYNQFGTWPHALAAYNWGPGNFKKWLNVGAPREAMPKETRDYVREISRDVL